MSINTLIAFVTCLGIFVAAILFATDDFLIFVHLSSFLIVVGGTLAATFLGQEFRYVMLALRGIFAMFAVYNRGRSVLGQDIKMMIEWAQVIQQKGLVGLEQEYRKVEADDFLAFGLENLLSGYSGEELRDTMDIAADKTFERNVVPAKILATMAQTAPAFGMIGTLIGLVIMLASLQGDPEALGKGLATALITTLYGVLFARFFLTPASTKLTQRHQITRFRHEVITEGLGLLAERRTPRYVADRLNSYLDPSLRFDYDAVS